jgi:prepilin-type N-terminal cleavage/methylation domain-containing protein
LKSFVRCGAGILPVSLTGDMPVPHFSGGAVMKKVRAFTLIEILVVVSIVVLLVAILIPSLSGARRQARRAVCSSNLHQVGTAMVSYLQTSGDRMPSISMMPSIGPAPLKYVTQPVYLSDALFPQMKGRKLDVMRCPDDVPGMHPDWYTAPERDMPNTGKSYWDSERSSYAFNCRLNGLMPSDFNAALNRHWHNHNNPNGERKVSPDTIWCASDYENFHGKGKKYDPDDPNPDTINYGNYVRCYVFIDGHVSNYEN